MAQSETLTALDIGSSKVVCAIAEISPDWGLEVVARGVAPCRGLNGGVLVDSAETVAAVEQAISQAETSGYSIGSVVVGLSSENLMFCAGHGVTAASNKESEFTKTDVARVQANSSLVGVPSDYEVISTITRSYIVDGQRDIVNPVGLTGVRLEAESYVCAAPLTYIQNVRKIINKAGLDICKDGLLPVAMASSLAVLTDEERDLGAVMLDMGMGTVDMAVYTAKEIGYSAVLAKGGWILTNDVACFFNIAKSEAERLILSSGAASPEYLDKDAIDQELKATSASGDAEVTIKRRELAEVIEARLLEIMEWVGDHLKEAKEQYGLNASSVVLTGGVALLPGIAQRFKKELGLPTRVASPCYPANLPAYLSEPIYSTVVGLLAFGANLIKQNSGDVPEVVYQRKGVVGFFYRICEWFGKVF